MPASASTALSDRLPVADIRFTTQGFDNLSLRGIVLRQSEVGVEPAVNPWIGVGIALGAVAEIRHEDWKSKRDSRSETGGGNGF